MDSWRYKIKTSISSAGGGGGGTEVMGWNLTSKFNALLFYTLTALFPFKVPGIEWPPVNEQCNPEHSVEIRQNITEYIREKLQPLAAQILDGY